MLRGAGAGLIAPIMLLHQQSKSWALDCDFSGWFSADMAERDCHARAVDQM
jgi:hypothetical protein